MISNAFKGAVQSEVQSRGQVSSNMFRPAKEFGAAAISILGMKNFASMAGASLGEAATESITQEKMLSAVQNQQSLDAAYERAVEGAKQEDARALYTVYEKLTMARAEQDAKRKIMDELKRGEEE